MAREDYVGKYVVLVLTYQDVLVAHRDLPIEQIDQRHIRHTSQDLQYASQVVLMDKEGRTKVLKTRASNINADDIVYLGRPQSFLELEIASQPWFPGYPQTLY